LWGPERPTGKDHNKKKQEQDTTMSDTPSRQRMERGDTDPQTSGRSTTPIQYGRGKLFYYKNKNFNGQQRNINSLTSPASMKFALQAEPKRITRPTSLLSRPTS
jgi:hypothetical protein